ncbi:MAG: restriction endonuclease subunit S [Verrucomicrobia bacterium]|nr:restriction endonuclease subunit S [Verrucomicrobiota bacterium]
MDTLAQRGTGHTPTKREPAYWGGRINWVSLADTESLDKGAIDKTVYRITKAGIENSSAVIHSKGTVILLRGSSVGKSAILDRKMAVSQDYVTWTCGPELLNLFLYEWLQWKKPEFDRISNGSTVHTIGLPYFEKLSISLPSYPEQQRIAEILSTWVVALHTLESLIGAKERRRRGLTQRLFGERNHKIWQHARLDFVFDEVTRPPQSNTRYALSITAGRGFVDRREKYSNTKAGRVLDHYILLRRGEFAYNKGNSTRFPYGCIYRLEEFNEGAVPGVWICFSIKDSGFDPLFYKYFFLARGLDQQLQRRINYGVRNDGLLNLAPADFWSIQIPVPTLAEQKQIGELLEQADAELRLLRKQYVAIATQKRGLMQLLLTGKKRVRV